MSKCITIANKSLITGLVILFYMPLLTAADYSGPDGYLSETANVQLWRKYCTGNPNSPGRVKVKYTNALVKRVVSKLNDVAPLSYYFYSGPAKAYGFTKSDGDYSSESYPAPPGVNQDTHVFLVLLCGEFRDRATMVEEKLRWIDSLYKLPVSPQGPIDPSMNVWSQLSAHSYQPYLELSAAVWDERQKDVEEIHNGHYTVDTAVPGFSVCETKYMLSEYVAKQEKFSDIESFNAGLETYKTANCGEDELNHYYNFRGDSNFKPYSPESNGMIWYATRIADNCRDTKTAKGSRLKNEDCANYFTNPFGSRWNAARAGLATWLFRNPKYDHNFESEERQITVVAHFEPASRPFEFWLEEQSSSPPEPFAQDWKRPTGWQLPDIGFNGWVEMQTPHFKANIAYERLRDTVDRHTDWYASGFHFLGRSRKEAYSPLVASSYEMSKSDAFTAPGHTVHSPSDGRKHWMYVFKVKRSNLYNTETLKAQTKIDFSKMWFDETSLGSNELAQSERAWDRLGTPLEGEFDSILYLHNITTEGEVKGD